MSQAISIRPMAEEDISEVLAIDRKLIGSRRVLTYADPLESYIGGNVASSWVAEVNGRVAGFVLCREVEPALGSVGGAWIELLGVDPDYHRLGVGKKLIEYLVQHCRQRGLERLTIIADRHDDVFRQFFSALGFKQGDAINYTLRLER